MRSSSSLARSVAVASAAVLLVPVVLLAQYLAFVLLIGYDPPTGDADFSDGWGCFRAVVFIGHPSACPERYSFPTPLEAAGAAGVSLLAGVTAAAFVVLVSGSGPWHDRRFGVALAVRITTAVAVVGLLLWTSVSTFGLYFADSLAI